MSFANRELDPSIAGTLVWRFIVFVIDDTTDPFNETFVCLLISALHVEQEWDSSVGILSWSLIENFLLWLLDGERGLNLENSRQRSSKTYPASDIDSLTEISRKIWQPKSRASAFPSSTETILSRSAKSALFPTSTQQGVKLTLSRECV